DLDPDDFGKLREIMAARWGPHRLTNGVQYTRGVFRFAYESGLIDRPCRFGPAFRRPSPKPIPLHRAAQGPKLFAADRIRCMPDAGADTRRMLGAGAAQFGAMILRGINCAFGNNDCGTLRRAAINLDTGWIDYPRPKTGMPRRCPLWPETAAALREALAARPA